MPVQPTRREARRSSKPVITASDSTKPAPMALGPVVSSRSASRAGALAGPDLLRWATPDSVSSWWPGDSRRRLNHTARPPRTSTPTIRTQPGTDMNTNGRFEQEVPAAVDRGKVRAARLAGC